MRSHDRARGWNGQGPWAVEQVVEADSTLAECDRVGGNRADYSVKHRRHGVNLQVIICPSADLVWISPPLPGRTHDLSAARRHRVVATLARLDIPAVADTAYTRAGPHIIVPARRRPGKDLTSHQQAVNKAHARFRSPVERGVARVKAWRVLRHVRCSPTNSQRSLKPSSPWRGNAEKAHCP
ncbi:transposase family protein [Streptomyces sp. NPDC020800]|uniref:transposase family protein n=1 Tax=Streptomyces sp. NPDC020800 TaxID=3365092 RepID=UPI00379000FA